MNLHRLTLRAIGPYAGEHTVDFAELGASGTFLLEGPTGAGKSTVIDAIVFALYGSLAGEGASRDRLRSHHAAPEVEPFVELVFETAAGIHRVRRTPAWRRPKKTGTGTTPANATASLVRLTSPDATGGEPVSTSTQEVGGEIGRILGLTRQQFVQTVVLPQGEFAAFLRSTGEERRTMLQSLFGTEIYEATTAQLVEARRSANTEVAAADHAVELGWARLREAAGVGSEDELGGTGVGTGAGDEPAASGFALDGDAALGRREPSEAEAETGVGADAAADAAADAGAGADADAAAVVVVRDLAARLDAGPDSDPDAVVADLAAAAATAQSLRDLRAARRDELRSTLDARRRLREALDRRVALLVRAAQLEAAEPAVREARDSLDAAARSDLVTGAARGAARAEEAVRTTADELARAARAASAAGVAAAGAADAGAAVPPEAAADADAGPGPAPDPDAAELVAERDRLRSELAVLAETAKVEAALPARRAAVESTRARLSALDEARAAADAELAGRPEAREVLEAERDDAARRAGGRPAAEQALDTAEQQAAALDRVAVLERDAEQAATALASASRDAVSAVEAESALRLRQIAGLAGQLATTLSAGEPCPVCGSVEHPAPASLTPEHPSDDDVERASARARTAQDAQRRVAELASAAEARRDDARAALGDLKADAARAVVDAARLLVAEAVAAEQLLAAAERALVAFDADTERRRSALAVVLTEHATLAERLVGEQRRLDDDAAVVAAALAGAGESVVGIVAERRTRAEAAERLLRAVDAHGTAVDARAQREAELAAALAESGFDAAAAAARAVLPTHERDELRARVGRHEADLAVVASGLAEPEVAGLSGDEQVDVDSAVEALAAAEAALAGAAELATRRGARATASAAALDDLRRAQRAGAEVADEARAVVRMADLASATGSVNVKGVTLGTYVLLRRFDDVVVAANARLSVMSSGRYALEASDEREQRSRSRRVGLALAIRDHATDTTRDPASFSGGETFYASLSLALGLADVVQAEAGGLELGTLFVDEGFGSLDPETLDAVMTELGRLSDTGRVIGIVSHVDELKQRIADRIEVRRQPDGSSVLRTTVGS
ncbi:exonuclease SbcC [Frigoribacterium sp. PhB107]|uniref:AAA family ATPase n=1 Tax=Frigoribacterium sp. PhB107 TaxID=2485172 RepID=UPI000F4A5C0B|nr:SMC family ATPase [Frigoribacterium sp. PhB107]ROP78939.1 exonuclease SbcC [Frigoribacterium sp. PhB107]